MASNATIAVGVDIGGTGIKGALVDVDAGVLLSDRVKVATPPGAEPDDVDLDRPIPVLTHLKSTGHTLGDVEQRQRLAT